MEPVEPTTATPEKSTKRRAKRADNKIDTWFKSSRVDKYFKVTERGSNFTTEFIAGCTTFLTACYIMAVNPNILSVTGLNYEGLVFATAMSSCVATLIMGLWANLPFGLWPGMGMNAYFAYTIVGFKGTLTPVKKVMFAVLIEGVVFMVMSALDVRRYIMKTFPRWLMSATMAGIGLFLAQIGLHAGNGIDLVRDHPAIYVDAFNTNIDYSARTWLGIFMFFLMAALVTLGAKGAVMVAILASTFLCWTLEAAGEKQFVYQPQCCLGSITYTSATSWYPRPGSSWIGPKEFLSQPICGGGPEGVFEVPGSASNVEIEGNPGFYASSWSGAKVTGSFYNWTVTEADGTEHYVPGKALSYQGNGDGRNGLGNKGDCNDVCHQMFGGFGGVVPGEYGYGPCWGTIMTDASCWTSMTPSNDNQATEHEQAAGAINLDQSLAPITVIDGFGAGCTGGAGREPRTFEAPSKVAEAPYAKLAGAIVSAWPGWFGCSGEMPGGLCTADGEEAGDCSCFAGNVDGGTVWAFDTSDLDMQNFGIPLLVLLRRRSLQEKEKHARDHTAGFLYAAADCSGLIDPTTGTFEGCYAAFWADAIGTFFGAILGTSSVTTYGESMAGVYEGGRTGLTALWIALFNFLSMFFAPLFGSIPTLSTGPALIMVGVFMAEGLGTIDWHDYMQAIPSVVTVLLMPATYKIEVGILAGLMTLAMIKILTFRIVFNLPCGYESMPPLIQRFLKRQSLNAYERSIIAAAEGKPSAEA